MKKKPVKKGLPKRPERPTAHAPKFSGHEDRMAWHKNQRERPIARAREKLHAFVAECMRDPDFRDPQSEPLLRFLLDARDLLTDGINEKWSIDDIYVPIEEAVRKHASDRRMGGLAERNAAKEQAMKWAQNYAAKTWAAGSKVRVKAMAIETWEAMADSPHKAARPKKSLSLVNCVKAVAPAWARKPGRTPSVS